MKFLGKHKQNTILYLSDLVNSNNIEYIYIGEFNEIITETILSLAEILAEENLDDIKLKKRFYFILIEGLQNITRHQEYIHNTEKNAFNQGLLVFQRINSTYIITTGNPIKTENIPYLEEKLKKINSLSQRELRSYYKQILMNKTFSEKGGAGLGLIEIARKSNNKLYYDFQQIDQRYSYFYMQTIISRQQIDYVSDIKKIKDIHSFLRENNITLVFSGIFNHDKLINLLSLLEANQNINLIKNKVFSIIIEMLQNIVKHADDYVFKGRENRIFDIKKGKYAIFFISDTPKYLKLISGNYIKNLKVGKFRNFLDKINQLNYNELTRLHFQTLLKYKQQKQIQHGLGIIDLRIKSRNRLSYDFIKVNPLFSFFTLEVKIDKHISKKNYLRIEASSSTPKILLSEREGKFIFCGRSFPQNAEKFYKPVIDWLDKYAENPAPFTIFIFKLKYVNTPSQQQLIKILSIIEKIAQSSAVIVKWYYEKDNEDALLFGVEFSQLFNIQFDLIETEEIKCD